MEEQNTPLYMEDPEWMRPMPPDDRPAVDDWREHVEEAKLNRVPSVNEIRRIFWLPPDFSGWLIATGTLLAGFWDRWLSRTILRGMRKEARDSQSVTEDPVGDSPPAGKTTVLRLMWILLILSIGLDLGINLANTFGIVGNYDAISILNSFPLLFFVALRIAQELHKHPLKNPPTPPASDINKPSIRSPESPMSDAPSQAVAKVARLRRHRGSHLQQPGKFDLKLLRITTRGKGPGHRRVSKD
jgi:hypothetical protein